MNYAKQNNTYFATPKDDPKDRIQVEVGDSKQPDFKPQVKLMRWDNEVNFSVRLSTTETASPLKTGDKINWDTDTSKIEFYDFTEDEGGYKLVWFLKEKPLTNKVEFTIQSKGLDFFYQPELTAEEVAQGASRPENVVGSYAVYHQTKGGMNDSAGMEYKCGKAFHIYRPHIIDAEGKECWGNLHIENGIYSVEIPQDFLDKAVYPIKSNDTFGYTTGGESHQIIANNDWDYGGVDEKRAGLVATGAAGTLDSISAYVDDWGNGVNSASFKAFLNKTSDGSQVVAITRTGVDPSPAAWQVFTAGSQAITAQNYAISVLGDGSSQGAACYILYDSVEDTTYLETQTYETPESPWTFPASNSIISFSIYATYTASGGAEEYTLEVTTGSFTLTGVAAGLKKDLKMSAAVGSFTLTGIATNLKHGYTLTASAGSFTLTGIAALFKKALKITAALGEFTLTGITTGLKHGHTLIASAGSFTLTGIASLFKKGWKMAAALGEFTLTGIAAGFNGALHLPTTVGQFTLTGVNTNLKSARSMIAAVGEFTLTGIDITLSTLKGLTAEVGSFTLTGINAGLKVGHTLTASVGEFVLTGKDSLYKRGYKLSSSVGEFVLTGIAVGFNGALHLPTTVANFVLTGIDTALNSTRKLSAAVGEFILTGNANIMGIGYVLETETASFTQTGIDAELKKGLNVSAQTGAFTLTGNSVGLSHSGGTISYIVCLKLDNLLIDI